MSRIASVSDMSLPDAASIVSALKSNMSRQHSSLSVICGLAFFGDDFIVQTGERALT